MVKFLLALLAIFILPGSVLGFWDALILITHHQELWVPLVCGVAIGIPVYFTVIKKIPALSTFEHELTHAIVALLFFRRIHKFVVTMRQGGQVQYSGNFGGEFGTLMIGLAPYYLPTFTLMAVLVRPFLPPDWFPWYDAFIGGLIAFHLFSTLDETKLAWTKRSFTGAGDHQKTKSDIGKVGYIFAFLVITGFGLFLLGLTIQLIGTGYHGTFTFLKHVGTVSYSCYFEMINRTYRFFL
jgi:hypothetical protein